MLGKTFDYVKIRNVLQKVRFKAAVCEHACHITLRTKHWIVTKCITYNKRAWQIPLALKNLIRSHSPQHTTKKAGPTPFDCETTIAQILKQTEALFMTNVRVLAPYPRTVLPLIYL